MSVRLIETESLQSLKSLMEKMYRDCLDSLLVLLSDISKIGGRNPDELDTFNGLLDQHVALIKYIAVNYGASSFYLEKIEQMNSVLSEYVSPPEPPLSDSQLESE